MFGFCVVLMVACVLGKIYFVFTCVFKVSEVIDLLCFVLLSV